MQPIPKLLSVSDHSRDSISMTYVYPVISRRASGVSIGINLNPNNACNWRCIYCQVPNLKRGSAPIIDLVKLEQELRSFLHELLYGRFMLDKVPQQARRINDIALSGNGEPTSVKEFEQVISLIERVKRDFPLPEELKLVLITNGSLIDRAHVQRGLSHMSKLNGEIWFKLDSVTQEGRMRINNTRMSLKKMHANLKIAASLCPTWLQTCVLEIDGKPPAEREIKAYLEFLTKIKQEGISLQGILLYGLARPSLQPEASRLSKVSAAWIASFAARIKTLGLAVKVHP
ncbi:wyosine [tRNA(Phe)-imidazoG37] synthetase (radical SAM superfamily) [Nitrosomonas communis]|uniref:Wyosine [tRNA(Phe)-imidazoG37] synthetase (Radical SAM superfamily) n=2 Tax=Nitrosomonas communis TaxID=44574 RepID=A0A1H2SD89_9PROT|nr:wyosine [tRNA(Phe)-imidazoG37] synthetase (radical SAM superfamily) [Nitrosomonas communis]SDW29611.1 Wyosine [tRNA(Phe)-imidazoG37] synthetase, radical SAM superfamily [Nitrosomonas communis]